MLHIKTANLMLYIIGGTHMVIYSSKYTLPSDLFYPLICHWSQKAQQQGPDFYQTVHMECANVRL